MIGIVASPSQHSVVREFFELFKTPWEFVQEHKAYSVVLCGDASAVERIPPTAKIRILYSGASTPLDEALHRPVCVLHGGAELSFKRQSLHVYGDVAVFEAGSPDRLSSNNSGKPIVYFERSGSQILARVGYDLFREAETLLVQGQPVANARTAALDLHIEFLRDLILDCGAPLIEIPPVPGSHQFIACLTHDVDFAAIRNYKFDATMLGFLYRATLGSLVNSHRGRLPARKVVANLTAAAKLPFVYMGLATDFWYEFDRDYRELEKGRPSTFYFIPFAGRPGLKANGVAPAARATGYDLSEVKPKIEFLMAAGCEIGLHGIDAWLEGSHGREEARRICEISGMSDIGVRMHWLYRDENSSRALQEAEFSYDSTVGYNETIGYRAGTGQVFKPLNATRLLELPMHIMDTALFYPSYLNCSEEEAWDLILPLLENAARHGGVLTINWHDRSLAPERLWGDFYVRLIDELSRNGAWFSTAAQAVTWFRKRREARFERAAWDGSRIDVKVTAETDGSLPGLRLRFHPARTSDDETASPSKRYTDITFSGPIETGFQA